MSESVQYWIWLQKALGVGKNVNEMLSYFGTPEKLYNAGRSERLMSGLVTHPQEKKLEACDVEQSRAVIDECHANGWNIITPDTDFYPDALRNIQAYPLALYVRGDYTVLSRAVCIAFVGTRNASVYGRATATQLSAAVAAAGAVVVSGGALGIDSAAHRGALSVNGKTVCVLGCGLKCDYLHENRELRDEIARVGALVSEFPPDTPASRTTFPLRNRIISGLSLGTVVIEAGERSGSLITARCTLEQGRDVFAVPGGIISSAYSGTNTLLRDGAKAVFSANDILCEYEQRYSKYIDMSVLSQERFSVEEMRRVYSKMRSETGLAPIHGEAASSRDSASKKRKTATAAQQNPGTETENQSKKEAVDLSLLSPTALKVYAALGDEIRFTDNIIADAGLSVSEGLVALTELEVLGLATAVPPNYYIKT